MKDGKMKKENGKNAVNGSSERNGKKRKKQRRRKSLRNLQKIISDAQKEVKTLEENISNGNGYGPYQYRAKSRLKQLKTKVIPRFEKRIAKIRKMKKDRKNRIKLIIELQKVQYKLTI